MESRQLSFEFDLSVAQRQRKAQQRLMAQELLFVAAVVDLDISLHNPWEAIATIAGDVEPGKNWLERVVGPLQQLRGRRWLFPAGRLDRLLYVRPPTKVTLDAASLAVARSLWAHRLGCAPLVVEKSGRRLLASSPPGSARWPKALVVRDAPWTTLACLAHHDIPLDVRDSHAALLLAEKIGENGSRVATAGVAGSTVYISTSQPQILEQLGLPALSYAGPAGQGRYKMPALAAESLLHEPSIELSKDGRETIRRLTGPVRPLEVTGEFPWSLYPFQARDAAKGRRILESAGGVLLAGDMGSGKTTVSLALAHQMNLFPLLVAAPLSAFSTWERQLREMGKEFLIAAGPARYVWEQLEQSDEFDAIVMSYDRLHAFVEALEKIDFKAIIADELQKTSSPGSRRSRALRQLAQHLPVRIGLSGTPMNNYLTDLLPLGSFLVPGEWKPRAGKKDLSDLYPGDAVEAVAEHLGAMMVRRRIDEVGVTLPDKNTRRVYVQLTVEQRRALEALRAQAEQEVQDGETERMHVFARLQRMRQIIASPSAAGVPGPNPKVDMAVELAEQFSAMGRKTVLFAVNRQGWIELGEACDRAGLGWVGVWGSTPVTERIAAERRFHADDDIRCFIGTVQSCAEAITLSPTGSVAIFTGYVYNPSQAAQAEARVYRLNQTNNVDIIYLHATGAGATLDDRFVEILEAKRALISQVVDRREHVDATQVHYSTGDLVFLLTGRRDERLDMIEADKRAEAKRAEERKRHAKATAHRRKYRNDDSIDVKDDGSFSQLLDSEDLASTATAATDPLDDDDFDRG